MQYIIPNSGDFTALMEVLNRSNIPFFTPQTIRELLIQSDGEHTSFAAVNGQDMMVLARHTTTLLTEMPSVVMSVPGVVYPSDWMGAVSIFPPLDWKTVEKSLSKSGETAYTPEEAIRRDKGALVSLRPMDQAPSFHDETPPTDDDIE